MARPSAKNLVSLAGAVALLGCGEPAAATPRPLVFAAASLGGAFAELALAFERAHRGAGVELHCAGTPQLVLQLQEGAPVDVFASADAENMARAVAAGAVGAEPVLFAHNRLAIAVAAGNPLAIGSLADLARPGLRVVLCGPEVPAGRYARRALARAGVAVRSLSDEPSVAGVLGKVRLGEVDAGVVYATDLAAAGADVAAVAIADEHNVVADCVIAVCTGGAFAAAGAEFVAFVRSPDGRGILADFGFTPP